MCVRARACVCCVCVRACVCLLCVCMYIMCVCVCVYVFVCVFLCVCCVHLCVCMCVRACVCVSTVTVEPVCYGHLGANHKCPDLPSYFTYMMKYYLALYH